MKVAPQQWKLKVCLNGTDQNPWHKLGLKQNPFPQLGKAEYDAAERQLSTLGADPIPDEGYIRKVLKGFNPEFVDLCCSQFKKGEYVQFDVEWTD